MPEFDSYETVKQRMQYFFSNIQPVEKQENTSKKKHRSGNPQPPRLFFSLNQIIIRDMENLCQRFQFQIGNIAFICLDPGNHVFIHIVACQLELAGKITLGETMFGFSVQSGVY